jgi:hypothetical protein
VLENIAAARHLFPCASDARKDHCDRAHLPVMIARKHARNVLENEFWTAMSAALAESRAAFDRANQTVWDRLKRAS